MAARRKPSSTIRGVGEEPALSATEWLSVGFTLSEENPIHSGYVTASLGAGPDWDMHYGLELGVVLSGRMRRYWGDWETEVGPGEVWLCGMWERHGWEAVTASCRHLVLVLLPQWLARGRFSEAPDLEWVAPFLVPPRERPQARGEQRREILAIVRRFEGGLSPDNPLRPAFLGVLAFELLLVLLGGWRPRVRRRTSDFDRYCDPVNHAVEIALGSRRSTTTAEVAKACGLSGRAFARVFEQIMGLSFSRFALRCRLGQAAARLVKSSDGVASVAAQWGFRQLRHFEECFKQHYGVSPLAYRRKRS